MSKRVGSSMRCTDRTAVENSVYRCRRRRGHDGPHQAPRGRTLVRWQNERDLAPEKVN